MNYVRNIVYNNNNIDSGLNYKKWQSFVLNFYNLFY